MQVSPAQLTLASAHIDPRESVHLPLYPNQHQVDYSVAGIKLNSSASRNEKPQKPDLLNRPANMSVIVREREREVEEDIYRTRSPPRTIRGVRRYRVHRPFDEEEAYEDLYERERLFERDRRRHNHPYEVQSFSRSTEYFSAPQKTVIIREEPQQIIIRERPRAPIIVPAREPERVYEDLCEDDVYYERDSRHGNREELYIRKEKEMEVEPRDSVSQWSSDDDIVYIHRETSGGRRGHSHRRHLAEGAAVGVAAEEIIRHHKKKEGVHDHHHKRHAAEAALAGAAGAEVLSKVRSSSRHRHNHNHQVEDLAKLGLGTAAIAAAVNYGMNRGRDKRSGSRRRRHSISGSSRYYDDYDSDDRSRSRHSHRGRHIAEAALGTAAAAGLIHHERSKSRRRSHSRSRSSHSRHGSSRHRSRSPTHKLPLAAAAAGTAAFLAHHEREKKKREQERRSRSRSRSRSVAYSDRDLQGASDDPGLIEYGDEPVYANAAGDYHRRQEAGHDTVPLAAPLAAGAGYAVGHAAGHAATFQEPERSRSGSQTRRHERSPSSSSSSPVSGRRRRRRPSDRHRGEHLAEAALAAGAAGLAAHEIKKVHDRKKPEGLEERHYTGDPYDERDYNNHPPVDHPPSPPSTSYYPATNTFPPPPSTPYYPATNTFPPPPAPMPYNPADYPPPPIPHINDPPSHLPIEQPDPRIYGGTASEHEGGADLADSVSDIGLAPINGDGGPPANGGEEKSVSFDLRPRYKHEPASGSHSPPLSVSSASTVELPPRFDEQGRRVGDRERDSGRDSGEELAYKIGEAVSRVGRVVDKVLGGK
ncbi:hypothetical protein FGG08_005287 [Glutinoglossum americanum]|uniref:DUF3824 domain-containing protein n=1 Tax=Glutinoglossum americanum TaxID=1670608 RepID=A0A9P8KW74_9PEZI|nr:hypothetical protein FGG08_005287 [Glutinoglossum americanum]